MLHVEASPLFKDIPSFPEDTREDKREREIKTRERERKIME